LPYRSLTGICDGERPETRGIEIKRRPNRSDRTFFFRGRVEKKPPAGVKAG
jgi:hypothetical protein